MNNSSKTNNFEKNKHCYMSGDELTTENISSEHIIPNALGGKLKSNYLINKKWNNEFGETIDIELIKQLPLATLLNIKRDRGRNPKIRAKSKDGIQYLVNSNLEGIKTPTKPVVIDLEGGRQKIEFVKGQENGIIKKIVSDNNNLNEVELREKINWNSNSSKQNVFFRNLSLISGKSAVRGICKIVANYYVFISNEIDQIKPIIPFLKNEDDGVGILKYYYPEKDIIKYKEDEISHIIHITGNENEELLYADIELFSCHSFLVILNNNYTGADIKETYCYDLITCKEIQKNIDLKITKKDIKKMNFPQDDSSENEYFKRLTRIGKIKNIEFNIEIQRSVDNNI